MHHRTDSNDSTPGSRRKPYRALLLDLDAALVSGLTLPLRAEGCRLSQQVDSADIVFCRAQLESLNAALRIAEGRPVIAVSQLPETSQWLDALEAGAADYCAAPFDQIHVRWLLDRHCRSRRAAFAAA